VTINDTRSLDQLVATAMETEVDFLPHLHYILQDLNGLGTLPRFVHTLLKHLPVPPKRALDLGCGKGAVSISLAQVYDCECFGVDAFAPFIEDARLAAGREGLEDRCRFVVDDLRSAIPTHPSYDLLIFSSVGDVLGDHAEAVGRLRPAVQAGGWLIIGDCVLKENASPPPGYETVRDEATTRAALGRHGDRIVATFQPDAARYAEMNRWNQERIRIRAAELTRQHPELGSRIGEYVHRQEIEIEHFGNRVDPILFLIQKRVTASD